MSAVGLLRPSGVRESLAVGLPPLSFMQGRGRGSAQRRHAAIQICAAALRSGPRAAGHCTADAAGEGGDVPADRRLARRAFVSAAKDR